ncbi:outer membrane protein assembly factor [Rhizobiales bacterium]|uniref:autotransporter assembly complex protein TamA n=1 Tax=Hongsoonwoonella zoysiae TaxID=2821844 RepID=UPI00156142F9|nr:autotransporter assembly complex family protein [Hongsoonwoonella zoysiae]NRG18478.1 outer membrane protein assembly factor [Hongsoonwoonella zoysiae]
MAVSCLLAACATAPPASAFELFGLTFFGDKEEATPQVEVPDPLPYSVKLTVSDGNEELRTALEAASILISQKDSPPSGEAGLIARAVSDFERLVGRLFIDGRYGATIDIRLAGERLEAALETGDLPDVRPVPVTIAVEAGPVFSFGDAAIRGTDGGALEFAGLNDPASFGLVKGDSAGSRKILTAENAIADKLKAEGYPLAEVVNREVIADHDTDTLDVTLIVDPGREATFGAVTVEGTEVTDPAFVAEYAVIPTGSRYDPEALKKAEKRLNDLGIFSSVRIVEGDSLGPNGSLPITIQVSERKRHVIGVGANWSSSEGFGLEGYWRRRNLFGAGELLSVEGSVGRIGNESVSDMEYALRVAFEKPGAFGPMTDFTASVGAKQENPDAYLSRSISADAFIRHRFNEQVTGRVGTELYYAEEEDVFGKHDYFLVGIPADIRYDSRDDILNPTKGIFTTLFGEPAYDVRNSDVMFFLRGDFSTYRALGEAKRFVLAGRVAAGSIIGPDLQDIPASRRYFLGGGGTIRGYAYRNVGPRLNGEVTGGRSFILASGEVRFKITDTIGAVGFVDAGNAFATMYPDFSENLRVGVGAGLRYFTPVGPLRLDVAVPLDPGKDDPSFAVYVGLSQAF